MIYELVWRGARDANQISPVFRQAFTWKTEPPTQAGWYWAYVKPKNDQVKDAPELVYVSKNSENLLFVECKGSDYIFDLIVFTHWLGPIPEPIMPSEDQRKDV